MFRAVWLEFVRLRQFRGWGSFVDDPAFTFAIEGKCAPSYAQGIWCEIMAEQIKSPNLGAGEASTSAPAATGLGALQEAARQAGRKGPPPVHLWNPPYCGDIGLKIARDGTWFYQGTPIGRMPLVKLFASILRKDPDRHVLVTPVEKVAVEVEDAPFLAVEMQVEDGPVLRFRTNVDDFVVADVDHPLRFERGPAEGIKPYIKVRGDLWALVTRALLYDLAEIGEIREVDGAEMFGVESSGIFFPMARADDMEAFEADGPKGPAG